MPWNCHTIQGRPSQDETTEISPVGEAQQDSLPYKLGLGFLCIQTLC